MAAASESGGKAVADCDKVMLALGKKIPKKKEEES